MDTYLAIFHNPAGNPEDIEEVYLDAEDNADAQEQSERHVANHIFTDVSLLSVKRIDPGEFYHDTST